MGLFDKAVSAPAAPAGQEWICPACSGKNEGGKFCSNCGSPRP